MTSLTLRAARPDKEGPAMPQLERHASTGAAVSMRLGIGFVAGFFSVLIFQMATIAILQDAGVAFPFAAWSMEPVPPLAVPRSLSAASIRRASSRERVLQYV